MPPKKSESDSSSASVIERLKKKYPQSTNTEKFPTGILPIDFVLRGGYVPPMFCQIAGDSGCGKSTVALTLAKNLIKRGHRVLYLNFEQAVIQNLAERMGLLKCSEDKFLMLAPSTIGEGEDIIKELIYCKGIEDEPAYNHIFFDSVGYMAPDWAEEKDIDSTDNTPALRARQMSKFFDLNNAKLKRRNICCWFVNHLSLKIETGFGKTSEKTTKGGTAVQYGTDVWLYLEKGKTLDQKSQDNVTGGYNDKNYYGNIATIKVAKGRTGGMGYKTECPIFFGVGVSNAYWLYLILKNEGYIKTNGSYLKCTLLEEDGVNLLGIPKCLTYLKENQKKVIAKMQEIGIWNFFDENANKVDA